MLPQEWRIKWTRTEPEMESVYIYIDMEFTGPITNNPKGRST